MVCELNYLFFLRPPGSQVPKWFKFDDGEVSEAKMDEEEVDPLIITLISTIFLRNLRVRHLEESIQEKCMITFSRSKSDMLCIYYQ